MADVKRVPGEGKKQLEDFLKTINHREVAKVGWFESSKYPDGTPVAAVAAIQEFGDPSKNIPSRSFMRVGIANKKKEWKRVAEIESLRVVKGKITFNEALNVLGAVAAGNIRKIISLIQSPQLKKSTIAARLRKRANKKTVGNLTKPLIDTNYMYSTLTNTVEEE